MMKRSILLLLVSILALAMFTSVRGETASADKFEDEAIGTANSLDEAANLANGFYQGGNLILESRISQTNATPTPYAIDEIQVFEAILEYIRKNYEFATSIDWVERGIYADPVERVILYGGWVVTLKYMLLSAAPRAPIYHVTIVNRSEEIHWEGIVIFQGGMDELRFIPIRAFTPITLPTSP